MLLREHFSVGAAVSVGREVAFLVEAGAAASHGLVVDAVLFVSFSVFLWARLLALPCSSPLAFCSFFALEAEPVELSDYTRLDFF